MVAAVRDDPAGRLALASRFYDRRIGRKSIRCVPPRGNGVHALADPPRGARGAERSIGRGARGGEPSTKVSSPTHGRPIEWVGGAVGEASRPSVACWVSFLRRPSGASWYRAHNASVVAGYVAHRDLAHTEHPLERFFMDVALVRVLFAECMLSEPRTALGRFAAAGRPLADPRWRGADVFLSLHNILPDQYPLDGLTIEQILDSENVPRAPGRLRRDPSPRPCRLRTGRVGVEHAPVARHAARRCTRVRLALRSARGMDDEASTTRHADLAEADVRLRARSARAGLTRRNM